MINISNNGEMRHTKYFMAKANRTSTHNLQYIFFFLCGKIKSIALAVATRKCYLVLPDVTETLTINNNNEKENLRTK